MGVIIGGYEERVTHHLLLRAQLYSFGLDMHARLIETERRKVRNTYQNAGVGRVDALSFPLSEALQRRDAVLLQGRERRTIVASEPKLEKKNVNNIIEKRHAYHQATALALNRISLAGVIAALPHSQRPNT